MENGIISKIDGSTHSLHYQYFAVFTGILVTVCIGLQAGWTSPTLPLLLSQNSTIPTTSSEGSWMVVFPYFPQPLGCIVASLAVNRIGRRRCLLISSPIYIVSWLIIAYATNVTTIYCARALSGLASSIAYTALPLYVSEIADKNIRGFLGCTIQTSVIFGIFLINLIGQRFDIYTTALVAISVPALHFITFCWMPESPYYFILKTKNRKAATSLRRLSKTTNANAEISELCSMIESASTVTQTTRFLDIFTKRVNSSALGIILGLRALEQFSGFYVILFYCQTIFNEIDYSMKGGTATLIYLGTQLAVSILSCGLVDQIGRRILLIISVTGSGCAMMVEGVYFYLKHQTSIDLTGWGFVSLAALLVYTCSYSIGLTTIPTLMTGEIFQPSIKAYASGISVTCVAIFVSIVSKSFQILKDTYGIHVPFFMFALCSAVGLLFIIYTIPETRGRSLEEIQLDWIHKSTKISSKIDSSKTPPKKHISEVSERFLH